MSWFTSSLATLVSGSQGDESFLKLRSSDRCFFLGKQRNTFGRFLRFSEVSPGGTCSILIPAGDDFSGWSKLLECSTSVSSVASKELPPLPSGDLAAAAARPTMQQRSSSSPMVSPRRSLVCPCCEARLEIAVAGPSASSSQALDVAAAARSSSVDARASDARARASDARARTSDAGARASDAGARAPEAKLRAPGFFPALGPHSLHPVYPRPMRPASVTLPCLGGPGSFRPIETYQTHLQPRPSCAAFSDSRAFIPSKHAPPPATRGKPRGRRRRHRRRRKRTRRRTKSKRKQPSIQDQAASLQKQTDDSFSSDRGRDEASSKRVQSRWLPTGRTLSEQVASPLGSAIPAPCSRSPIPEESSSDGSDYATDFEELADDQGDLLIPYLQKQFSQDLWEQEEFEEALHHAETEIVTQDKLSASRVLSLAAPAVENPPLPEESQALHNIQVPQVSPLQGGVLCLPESGSNDLEHGVLPVTSEMQLTRLESPKALDNPVASPEPLLDSVSVPAASLFLEPVGGAKDISIQEAFLQATGLSLVGADNQPLKLALTSKVCSSMNSTKRTQRELKKLQFNVNYERAAQRKASKRAI